MQNPTDKNGNIINTGDRVVYRKGTPDEEYGVVTRFKDETNYKPYIEVWVKWSDGCELYVEPSDVELVSTVTTDTFTKEDQAMLEMLIAKKEKAAKLRDAAEESLANLVENFYDAATDFVLADFVMSNIDEICNVLQNYKRTVQTN